ncbi:hypothetical protein [Azospirillum melinis]
MHRAGGRDLQRRCEAGEAGLRRVEGRLARGDQLLALVDQQGENRKKGEGDDAAPLFEETLQIRFDWGRGQGVRSGRSDVVERPSRRLHGSEAVRHLRSAVGSQPDQCAGPKLLGRSLRLGQ